MISARTTSTSAGGPTSRASRGPVRGIRVPRHTAAPLAWLLLDSGAWFGNRHARSQGRPEMQDVLYLGLIVGFLALSWGLVELCDRL